MSLFDSIAGKAVVESIARLRADMDKVHYNRLEELENFYTGQTKDYLRRHPGEEPDEWNERQDRFAHFGYAAFIGRKIRAALYGGQVLRELNGVDDATQQTFQDVYRLARMASVQRLISQGQVILGDGYCFANWNERLQRVTLSDVHASRIAVEPDPDDPMQALSICEERVNPNSTSDRDLLRYWIWTPEWYNCVDQDGADVAFQSTAGEWMQGRQPNPWGIIPYIHWRGLPLTGSFYGISAIDGCVEINRLYNNRASDFDITLAYQAHSTPVIRGSTDTGSTVFVGPRRAIALMDPTAGIEFPTPQPHLEVMQGDLDKLIERMFQIGGVPLSVITGETEASGVALAIKYRTMQEVVQDLAVSATEAEEDLARLVCIIGSRSGLGLPEEGDPKIDLKPNLLPVDRVAQQESDRLDVQDGLMTDEDYLLRNRDDIKTQEQADEYMKKLAEKKAEIEAKRKAQQTVPNAADMNVGGTLL